MGTDVPVLTLAIWRGTVSSGAADTFGGGGGWGRRALSVALKEMSDLIVQIHARVVAVAWSWELGLGLNAKSVLY